LTNLGSAVSVI